MKPWFTESEIEALTRRKRPSAQARVLQQAGIPFQMVDNRPLVMRDYAAHTPKPEPKLRLVR